MRARCLTAAVAMGNAACVYTIALSESDQKVFPAMMDYHHPCHGFGIYARPLMVIQAVLYPIFGPFRKGPASAASPPYSSGSATCHKSALRILKLGISGPNY